ncbi:restriction endonuclease [Leptospira sp. 96542]|nr:restriction endonuclease [Leptospira sp. 96542]
MEEAILFLLRNSGYSIIDYPDPNDDLIQKTSSGLKISGRGACHQIDAIADFFINPPFSNPTRLLAEAKCYSKNPVGIEIVRNAVGVLKDLNEFWVTRKSKIQTRPRFDYQYTIFSASSFTKDAERYAYAQNIHLVNLQNNKYLQHILDSIQNINSETFFSEKLSDYRMLIRDILRNKLNDRDLLYTLEIADITKFEDFINSCRNLNASYIAMANWKFPIFLVPAPNLNLDNIKNKTKIQIFWDDNNWYILNQLGQNLFSFNLPLELFKLYAEDEILTEKRAINLKEAVMSKIQIIIPTSEYEDEYRLINLELDLNWLKAIKAR